MQTSGRSLHAQEMSFNDIRTTLQALCAIYDNANSLHTNAYDEAVTTPTDESVRRAVAIQMVINREWGLAANDNPLQGSFVVEELTDLVEEAVLAAGFERISARVAGALGAMETGYQAGARSRTSRCCTSTGSTTARMPIVGVNTFRSPDRRTPSAVAAPELARRSDDAEKQDQLQSPPRLPVRATASGRARVRSSELQPGRARRRQHLRGADGRGAPLLARARSPPALFAGLVAARGSSRGRTVEAAVGVGAGRGPEHVGRELRRGSGRGGGEPAAVERLGDPPHVGEAEAGGR